MKFIVTKKTNDVRSVLVEANTEDEAVGKFQYDGIYLEEGSSFQSVIEVKAVSSLVTPDNASQQAVADTKLN